MAVEFVQRGRSLVEQGQLPEAVRVCRLGLLANPGDIEGRLVLGSALAALGRYDEVLAEMKQALAIDARNPSALALKGEALLRKGDPQQALIVLNQAAQLAFADPYVERLQAEALAATRTPLPAQTLEIDPELEGVEILEDPQSDPGIELLDEDLLVEATPSPFASIQDPVVAMGLADTIAPESIEAYVPNVMADAKPRLATIGTLFPDDESGVSGVELAATQLAPPVSGQPVARVPRAMTADMELIRGGLTLGQGQPPQGYEHARHGQSQPPAANMIATPSLVATAAALPLEPRRAQTPAPKRRQAKVPSVVWMALLAVSVAGGVVTGLRVREELLSKQLTEVRASAAYLSSQDTYLSYRKARDLLGRIANLVEDENSRAALARAEAALVEEFGQSPAVAISALAMLSDRRQMDAIVAETYLALAKGKAEEANKKALQLTANFPNEAIAHYLQGKAGLLAQDSAMALTAINKAAQLGASPFISLALARAEALRGKYPEALAAIKVGNLENPALFIEQARILAASNELPGDTKLDATLNELILRSRETVLQENSLSQSQGAWAGLILAEVKLERGQTQEAREAVAQAQVTGSSRWLYSDVLTQLYLRLENLKEAKEEALRASEMWPKRSKPRITLALVALLGGSPEEAVDILDQLQDIDLSVEALIVRGRAHLKLGKLDEAVVDLDKALALRGRDSQATIARAQVDILLGNPSAGIGRLEPMYDPSAPPELAIAYASALRSSGKPKDARKILQPIIDKGASVEALIELAALERAEGRFGEARAVFRRAIELQPNSMGARLGAALLEIDDGQIVTGRAILDRLVSEGTENGLILVEAARARIWLGDSDSAIQLLDRAAASSSWLNWNIARERGRIFLRHQAPVKAISELQRAQSLRPTDGESWLLLMEAHFEASIRQGSAGRTLQDITKAFRDSPVRPLAFGIHALLHDRVPEAVVAFNEARTMLVDQKASRLELARVAYWLGRSHEVSGDLTQAEQWFAKATKLNASHSGAFYWLGQVQHQEQDFKRMLVSYQRAVAIDPSNNPLAWFFLGTSFAESGKKSAAIKALESFLHHYPDDSGGVVVEAKTLLGTLR